MGTGASSGLRGRADEGNRKTALIKHQEIENDLMKARTLEAKTVKLLLLGGSECGKSTLTKQMRILHMNGFNHKETLFYRFLIHANVVDAVQQLISAVSELKIDVSLDEQAMIGEFKNLRKYIEGDVCMSLALSTTIKFLWNCKAFHEAYSRRNEFYLLDSAKYYLDDIDRIGAADYMPTPQDILRSRAATMGIHEIDFHYRNYLFRMVDVGGQKTQRRKWIHCFENVTSVFFIAAISEYDQVSVEDRTLNRLQDSLILFKSVTSNRYLMKLATLLFLNKTDIFLEKIALSPLKACFPEYKGKNTYNEASEYILLQFRKQLMTDKVFYYHFTNATNTKNVEVVFAASMNTVLTKTLSGIGMY